MNAVSKFDFTAPAKPTEEVDKAIRALRSRAGSTAFTGQIVAQVRTFADPYASPFEHYFVTTDEDPGEVFEFGRPLKDCRFFPNKAIKKNVKLLDQFLAFARGEDTSEWRFWNIGLPNRKAAVGQLKEELKRFNDKINVHLSDLRKKNLIKVYIIGIHVRYDFISGMFDLHAHMICKVAEKDYDFVRSKLYKKFSKTDLEIDAIKNIAACATYILWGIIDHRELVDWPPAAFQEAWDLTVSKARLLRTGGDFAAWRRAEREQRASDPEAKAAKARKARHRAETAYQPDHADVGDRVLAAFRMTLADRPRQGLLLRRGRPRNARMDPAAPKAMPVAGQCNVSPGWLPRDTTCPSTPVGTTQESVVGNKAAVPAPAPASAPAPPASEAMPASGAGPALASIPALRPRRPQWWWWRAWPHGGERWPLRLPAPIRRRLLGCQGGGAPSGEPCNSSTSEPAFTAPGGQGPRLAPRRPP